MTPENAQNAVDEVVARLVELALRGEALELDTLWTQHPELSAAERERIRAAAVAMGAGATTQPRERSDAPAVDLGELASDERRNFGNYELLRELGRGGQGVVYLARDTKLNRRVALKVLEHVDLAVFGAASSTGPAARLKREAEVASKLDHPAICVVHEMGVIERRPFIAMRFVEGETLAKKIATAREARHAVQLATASQVEADDAASSNPSAQRRNLMRCVHLIERVARALHVAHEAHVIHRDIKPGNIMVTPAGEPVILDFGLARDDDSDAPTLTATGDALGTPAYMAPEQIDSRRGAVDARTDVYALGVTLFECLTLRRPFEAPTRNELQRAILGGPSTDVRRAQPAIPRDLAIVIATAMERDRGRRYSTALELAEELRRVREHEPIRARPAGPLLRLRRWAQRNPAWATAIASALLALGALAAVFASKAAEARRDAARWLARLRLNQAKEHATRDAARSLAAAFEAARLEALPELETNGALVAALGALRERRSVHAFAKRGGGLRQTANGALIAAVGDDGDLQVRAASSLALVGPPIDHAARPRFAFSRDARWLAVESDLDAPVVWSTLTWESRALAGTGTGLRLAFDSESRRLARITELGVELHAVDGSQPTRTIEFDLRLGVRDADWSRDGSWLWVDGVEGLTIFRVEDGQLTRAHHEVPPYAAFDAALDAGAAVLARSDRLMCLEFARELVVRDVHREPAPGMGDAELVRIAPCGARAVIASAGGGVECLDLVGGGDALRPDVGDGAIRDMAFSSDGSRVAFVMASGVVRVCDAISGRRVCELSSTAAIRWALWNDADARAPLVTADESGCLARWSIESALDERHVDLVGRAPDAHGCDLAAGMLAVGDAGQIVVRSVGSGARMAQWQQRDLVRWIDIARDGSRVAAACGSKVLVWELGASAPEVELPQQHEIWVAEFSADGRQLAIGGYDGEIRLHDTRDWSFVHWDATPNGAFGLDCIRFAPDGQRIVSVSGSEGVVRIWSVPNHRELAACRINRSIDGGDEHSPISVTFDRSGERVAITSRDGVLYSWDGRSAGAQAHDLHSGQLNDLAFFRDGARIAVASNRPSVLIVDTNDWIIAAELPGRGAAMRSLDVSETDDLLIAQDLDNVVYQWPLDLVGAAERALAGIARPLSAGSSAESLGPAQ